MPNPLNRVSPNAGVILGNIPDDTIAARPQLALKALQVISSWSHADKFMLDLYVTMLGGCNETATIAYLSLESRAAKITMINAVAKHVLDDKHIRLLNAIHKSAKSAAGTRDRIAHWLWGYSPQLPDAILLMDPRHAVLLDSGQSDVIDRLSKVCIVYRGQDFTKAIQDNHELCGHIRRLRLILRQDPRNANEELYRELCLRLHIEDT